MEKVRIELTNGKAMNIELYPEVAPKTVANFLELVDAKFYDGLCFHRVIPGFMIQGGGFKSENGALVQKHAEKTVVGEFASNGVANGLHHEPGVISMARTMVKDSASSQFFICVEHCDHLDGEYAAFGKTADEESLAVALGISSVATTYWQYYADVPVEPVVIKTVTRI